jgi:hypothetical protein
MSPLTNRKSIGTVKAGGFKQQICIDADSELAAKAMLHAQTGKENVFWSARTLGATEGTKRKGRPLL